MHDTSPGLCNECQFSAVMYRDDVDHPGESVAWGQWAITSNDPDFRGRGATDSGEDYGPAPGATRLKNLLWASWHETSLANLLLLETCRSTVGCPHVDRPATPAMLSLCVSASEYGPFGESSEGCMCSALR